MKMIKFEKALQDLAGALIDLANARILVEVFVEKIAEVLDFDPHRQGEGDEATGKGLGIGGGGGFRFGKEASEERVASSTRRSARQRAT